MDLINKLKRRVLTYVELLSISDYDVEIGHEKENGRVISTIRNEHSKYVTNISSPEMALSYELAHFIYSQSQIIQPTRVLDIGSGFSSYVLRLYKKYHPNTEVFSIDDDIEWLDKTRQYLAGHQLSTDNLVSLEEFIEVKQENGYDLILLDLNFVDKRKDYIRFAIDLLNGTGLLVFDDAHKVEYLREIKKVTKGQPGTLYSVRKDTLDMFGRFSLVYQTAKQC
jgi:predicted O-methyltransferase YrrM